VSDFLKVLISELKNEPQLTLFAAMKQYLLLLDGTSSVPSHDTS
jgi:hypothetical protein